MDRSIGKGDAMGRLTIKVVFILGWVLIGWSHLVLGQSEPAKPGVHSNMESIRKTVQEKGVVRVIVKVPYSSLEMSPSQGQDMEDNKKEVIAQMQDHGALLIEPIQGQPFIVMELNLEGVDRILELQLVESIREDTLSSPF